MYNLLNHSGFLPHGIMPECGSFSMGKWLKIQCEKRRNPDLIEFIKNNPNLDNDMKGLLAKFLDMNESRVQNWIEAYQQSHKSRYGASEC